MEGKTEGKTEILRFTLGLGWVLVDEQTAETLLTRAAAQHGLTRDECLKKLDETKLQAGTGIYYEPVYIASKKLRELIEKRKIERQSKIVKILCDCGHTIPESQVMSGSRGSSCSNCYDRISE